MDSARRSDSKAFSAFTSALFCDRIVSTSSVVGSWTRSNTGCPYADASPSRTNETSSGRVRARRLAHALAGSGFRRLRFAVAVLADWARAGDRRSRIRTVALLTGSGLAIGIDHGSTGVRGPTDMSHPPEEILSGSADCACGPSDQVGSRPEQHDHLLGPSGARSKAVGNPVSGLRGRSDRGRLRSESGRPGGPHSPCLATARFVGALVAPNNRGRQAQQRQIDVRNLDRPHRTADGREVVWIGDLLVPQELRPRRIGRASEVVDRTFAGVVPARRRLVRRLPQERVAGVGLTEPNHATMPGPVRTDANDRTLCTSGSSGSHRPVRIWTGARPCRVARGRSNQRRTPISL